MKKNRELHVGIMLNYITIAVGLISTLLFNPIIIRSLGQGEYGLYETVGSFVNYLAVLDLGFGTVVTRYTAKYEAEGKFEQRNEFLYTARRIYQYLSIAILLAGIVLYLFIDTIFGRSFTAEELKKAHTLFILVLATTVVSVYGQVYAGALNGLEKFILPRIIKLVKVVIGKVVCIAVVVLGAESIGYTVAMLLFELFGLIGNTVYARKYVRFQRTVVRIKEIKELLVYTSFLFLQAVAAQLYWQVDKLVLGAMIGTATVAIYSVSLNIHNIVQNMSTSIKDMLLPKATRNAFTDNSHEQLQQFMVKASRAILIVYGLALVELTVVGKEFISLWLGVEYQEAYILYVILAYSSIAPCMLSIGETVCRAMNKHQFLSYISIVAALINIILTILFVKYWGMVGAVVATAIGLIVANTIVPLLYYRKILKIRVFGYFSQSLNGILLVLCLVIVSGVLINTQVRDYSWLTLGIKIGFMAIVYLVGMMLFGFSSDERERVYTILRKARGR
jgi:O-antigen/teichoic acid export membrane protein